MRYVDIVFLQGNDDEERDVVDRLYGREGTSILYYGVTAESIEATVEHLLQWETGDEGLVDTEPHTHGPWGTLDDVFHTTDADTCLVLSANNGLGYAGLIRIIDGCPFCAADSPSESGD